VSRIAVRPRVFGSLAMALMASGIVQFVYINDPNVHINRVLKFTGRTPSVGCFWLAHRRQVTHGYQKPIDLRRQLRRFLLNIMKNNIAANTNSVTSNEDFEKMDQENLQSPYSNAGSGSNYADARIEFARRVEESTRLGACDAGCMAGD
jgi:hypothetical protein